MNENFEKDVRKTLEQGITAFESKVERLFNKYKDEANPVKVGKSIRHLYYDREHGFMKVQFKFSYTPEEIAFLEKAKGLSQEKLQLVEEYMDQLSKGDVN